MEKIKQMQENFLKEPRKSIEESIRQHKLQVKMLPKLAIFENKPRRLMHYLDFHKEYAQALGAIMKEDSIGIIGELKDDMGRLMMSQRIIEQVEVVSAYSKTSNPDEATALPLARAYASSLENLWKLLKKLIQALGMNPRKVHLNIPKLRAKLLEVETSYNADLSKLKSIVDSKLRNSIAHENILFESPDTIRFFDGEEDPPDEIARMKLDEVYENLVDTTLTILAIIGVENTAVTSLLEKLLKLNDDELRQYCDTGVLTPEMNKKISGS